MRKYCPEQVAGVIKAADEAAARRFTFTLRWDMERVTTPVIFENEIDWLYQPGDDPEWIFAFNRMCFWICLGQAYALTKDEKYAKAFAEQMTHWVAVVKQDDPRCVKAWRSIEVGMRLTSWLKSMQYFKDSPFMTESVKTVFYNSMTEHAEFVMGLWNTFNLMSNWGIFANTGLFMAGAMMPETERTRRYLSEAIRRLDLEVKTQIYRDGSHWEQSPAYHNEVLGCLLDVYTLADRLDIKLPLNIIRQTHNMCVFDVMSAKPNHREPLMGDSDDIDQRDRITRSAMIFDSSLFKARGYKIPDFDSIWEMGEEGLTRYEKITPMPPQETDYFLTDSGNTYMRSGWSENATWVHFHCGPLGAGHTHADKLHVDLFSRGEDILTDSGRFTYVFEQGRAEYKELRAHNTIMADNQDMYICKDSWECERLTRAINQRFYSDNKYGYTEGGHLGYMNLPNGVYLNRRVIFIKPDILVLADEYYSSQKHVYNQFFHFGENGILTQRSAYRWRFKTAKTLGQVGFICSNIGSSIKAKSIDTKISRHYNECTPAKGIQTEFTAFGSGCAFTVIALSDGEKTLRIE
ncbi:MAG: heparinase II/III family protein, partial [Clostridiales bacterium]|nr:heparinase II/III family protein [Clostridiales bacterium]